MNNDQLLVIERRQEMSMADTATKFSYTTIDKQRGLVLTLPMLFKSADCQTVLRDYVNKQIKASDKYNTPVEAISKTQTFYINERNQLVLVFQRGDIAPMYVGPVEMTIPTNLIDNQLVSHEYVK